MEGKRLNREENHHECEAEQTMELVMNYVDMNNVYLVKELRVRKIRDYKINWKDLVRFTGKQQHRLEGWITHLQRSFRFMGPQRLIILGTKNLISSPQPSRKKIQALNTLFEPGCLNKKSDHLVEVANTNLSHVPGTNPQNCDDQLDDITQLGSRQTDFWDTSQNNEFIQKNCCRKDFNIYEVWILVMAVKVKA